MALVTLRLGLKKGSNVSNVFSKVINRTITGSAMRVDTGESKPKPWPYKTIGYNNLHAWMDDTLKRFDDNSKIITVEGPPAIGKSKFAKELADDLGMYYLPMVTSDYHFINEYGYDLRDYDRQLPYYAQCMDEMKFIKDPRQENAPQLPFTLYHHKVSQYLDALMHLFNTGQGVVIERCCYTDNAFIEAMTEVGYALKEERKGYYELKAITLQDIIRPHLAIYLDASVDTVLKNFKKRGLGEEKTFHGDFLASLEENYKRKSIAELEKHAEVLSYDWNEPGDAETVVEDIERLDFDKYTRHDDKMADWRFESATDYNECRWFYTTKKQYILQEFYTLELYDCPRLYQPGEDFAIWRDVYNQVPGNAHEPGFNFNLGDKVMFKFGREVSRQPDVVTNALRERPSFNGPLVIPNKPPVGKDYYILHEPHIA